MLTDPALPEKMIGALLRNHHGLNVAQVTFLPIGADINSVVYRV